MKKPRSRSAVTNAKAITVKTTKALAKETGQSNAQLKARFENQIKNGLTEAIFGGGFGQGGQGPTVSGADPLFFNLRWYLISNMRTLLSQLYAEHGIIKTLIDVPVDDGLRGGIEIKTSQLDEEQIEELRADIDRNDDLGKTAEALKWNRLFGGAGLVIMTDQDPSTPFEIESLTEDDKYELRAVDLWELFFSLQNVGDYSQVLDGDQLSQVEYYDYYGIKLHHTRVIPFKGIQAPSFIRPRLRGWGLSEVEPLVRSFNQYLKSVNVSYEVLDEFKVDIFKIKNLANTLMSEEGTSIIQRRVQLANTQKNYQNALTMDSEDDYDHKQLSFAGLAEVMQGIRMQIAADVRMPITKLFGISATGFNSGQDDIEVYNGMVESSIRTKSKRSILTLVSIRCQMKFGFIPEDLSIEFKPLRILSAEGEENVKTQQFNRLLQSLQAGAITSEEWRDGVNRSQLLPIQLDPDAALELEESSPGGGGDDENDGAKEGTKGVPKQKQSKLKPKETKEAKS